MMKLLRLLPLTLLCAASSFGASKEILQLQRDVSLLQDQLRTVQRTLDEKTTALNVLLQQTQESASKTNSSVSNLNEVVGQTVRQQLTGVSGMSTKVDAMSDDVRGLKDSMSDIAGRLERLDGKLTDLANKQTLMSNPPPAPGAAGASSAPPQGVPQAGGAPPAGMSADKTFSDANRDRTSGNLDLALKGYQDYLSYYANTENAPNAQYYIGEIYYNRADYPNAVKAFDAVLERYPENPKTADAHYMKATSLLKTGQRTPAVQEFRDVVSRYPRTDVARRAQAQLKGLGLTAGPTSMPARKRH